MRCPRSAARAGASSCSASRRSLTGSPSGAARSCGCDASRICRRRKSRAACRLPRPLWKSTWCSVSARSRRPSTDTPHAPMNPPPKTHQARTKPMANEPIVSREAAESAAAAWVARRESAEWDAAAFEKWLAESASHRVAYYRLNAAWQEAGRLRALARGLLPPGDVIPSGDSPAGSLPKVANSPAERQRLLGRSLLESQAFVRRAPWTLAASVVLGLTIAVAVYKLERTPLNR